ncbi:hypothetical protein [Calycomorphotria hydatis]|uniref:Uncharacterized protein n=1 Tax=Calycomorphotria hydatis TaxID=2528027 RepID=A0A517TDU7_9PLAN|nr:hypothetical protein [Calycomorphotria hydatis]QDT66545.1 hypothetical protein V22_38150 [Calycomorphotria hydatis]
MTLSRLLHIFPPRACFGAITILAVLVSLVGVPEFDLPSIGGLFPCQSHNCGCRTAGQCWNKCCCYTPQQRLAWARVNGIEPPIIVVRLNASEHSKDEQKPREESTGTLRVVDADLDSGYQKLSPTTAMTKQEPGEESTGSNHLAAGELCGPTDVIAGFTTPKRSRSTVPHAKPGNNSPSRAESPEETPNDDSPHPTFDTLPCHGPPSNWLVNSNPWQMAPAVTLLVTHDIAPLPGLTTPDVVTLFEAPPVPPA